MIVGVIGAGAWGTALSVVSARGGSDVVLWSYDGKYKEFDDVEMPSNIQITTDMSQMRDCDVWLVVTPAAFFRETMRSAAGFYNNQPVIICTKGAESATGDFMSEIIRSELPSVVDFGVLSGPQFAAEVARGVPTGSTLAGTQRVIDAGRAVLNQLYINPSDDVIGTEFCGVGKNAVALICGYNSIAAAGENEHLCGIGDLFLSATSETSRNFAGGMAIARGNPPAGTVEGIFALNGLIRRAASVNVDVPTLRQMRQKMGLA